MKKMIISVLGAVMIATPCMAEVEPDGFFSVEGTEWIGEMIPGVVAARLGFYGGKIYGNLGALTDDDDSYDELLQPFYRDLMFALKLP